MATTTIPQKVEAFNDNLPYSWTQTLKDVEVDIELPTPARSKEIKVVFTPRTIKCTRVGEDKPFFSGDLHDPIDSDDFESTWCLTSPTQLQITLSKKDKQKWWGWVLKGEPEVDTSTIQPENSSLGELDPETRATVEKMMFDQRQKQMGGPTSDEIKKQEMLEKFKKMHPEMDFSNVKMG